MNIERSSASGRLTAGLSSAIGTTRVQLTDALPLVRGVQLRAVAGNAGIVYVGGPEVTATNGYPLAAGENIVLPVAALSQIHVIASQASQSIAWVGI